MLEAIICIGLLLAAVVAVTPIYFACDAVCEIRDAICEIRDKICKEKDKC